MTESNPHLSEHELTVEVRALNEVLTKLREDMYSNKPTAPGLMLRMDRMEQKLATALGLLKYIGSGGLVGLAGTLVLLWKIMGALSGAGS